MTVAVRDADQTAREARILDGLTGRAADGRARPFTRHWKVSTRNIPDGSRLKTGWEAGL